MQIERAVSCEDAIPAAQRAGVESEQSLLDLVDEIVAIARRICQETGEKRGMVRRVALVVQVDR